MVIPVYRTPEHYLREMIDSIIDQTYTNWELCIADGSPRGQSVERVLKRYAQKDPQSTLCGAGRKQGHFRQYQCGS